ncbi:hypothetical protein CC80DRAFT_510136 [Byssothecium circinans]|uniref:Uncharacterized protein n=1 Tax=Byssothecium circinans TaxID=147558 RepID=A0A6A5TCL7_9PLEO|nr:hypothetical protein CC80DRAFT_510136 [Byssothecium circinans]
MQPRTLTEEENHILEDYGSNGGKLEELKMIKPDEVWHYNIRCVAPEITKHAHDGFRCPNVLADYGLCHIHPRAFDMYYGNGMLFATFHLSAIDHKLFQSYGPAFQQKVLGDKAQMAFYREEGATWTTPNCKLDSEKVMEAISDAVSKVMMVETISGKFREHPQKLKELENVFENMRLASRKVEIRAEAKNSTSSKTNAEGLSKAVELQNEPTGNIKANRTNSGMSDNGYLSGIGSAADSEEQGRSKALELDPEQERYEGKGKGKHCSYKARKEQKKVAEATKAKETAPKDPKTVTKAKDPPPKDPKFDTKARDPGLKNVSKTTDAAKGKIKTSLSSRPKKVAKITVTGTKSSSTLGAAATKPKKEKTKVSGSSTGEASASTSQAIVTLVKQAKPPKTPKKKFTTAKPATAKKRAGLGTKDAAKKTTSLSTPAKEASMTSVVEASTSTS